MFALPGTSGTPADVLAVPTHDAAKATYELSAGLDGEIYPVFANYAALQNPARRKWGTVSVKVTNSSSQVLRNRLAVQIPGWSDPEIQAIQLGAGESQTYMFAPTLLRRAFRNHEIAAATATMTATGSNGQVVDQETLPVRLRSVDDLYWGRDFEYASFIASWVTPHDPIVEQLLARAKEYMPGRRLPGYESSNPAVQDRLTVQQASAIYRAMQEQGVSYVKSSMTLGGHEEFSERIRMPAESIDRSSANCIDGVVTYAAMFENLGMEPVIVLVPGHAYVGIRLAPGKDRYLYIETSLTGRVSFALSVKSARQSMAKFQPSDFFRIDIRQARVDGIYPMPSFEHQPAAPVLDASRNLGRNGT
ncbi:MAG: hypothetical protein ROO76_16700 [Terriglobia bacterium]|nr:hypothetical protein [Terriglobia bacterium]